MSGESSLSRWVASWKQEFTTDFSEEFLQSLVGKKVSIRRPSDEEMYELSVVGYSKTFLSDGENSAEQHSILTEDGRQVMLPTGVELRLSQD